MANELVPNPGVTYGPASWEEHNTAIRGDGVVEGLRVSIASGLNLAVTAGRVFLHGFTARRTTNLPNVAVDPNTAGTQLRRDTLVARRIWEITGNISWSLIVLYGVPASTNPQYPTLATTVGGPGFYDVEIASWITVGTSITNLVHRNWGPFPQIKAFTAARAAVPINGSQEIAGLGYKLSFAAVPASSTPETPEISLANGLTELKILQSGWYSIDGTVNTGVAVSVVGFVHIQISGDASNWFTVNVEYFPGGTFLQQFHLRPTLLTAGTIIRIGVSRTVTTDFPAGSGGRTIDGDMTLTMLRAA